MRKGKLEILIVLFLYLPLFYYQDVIVTAYTSSYEECLKEDGITASGYKAVEGITIAADHLPFGTWVQIDEHLYIVQDRFGAGHKNKIDIYKENKNEAITFGVTRKRVKVWDWTTLLQRGK